ncbi:Non-specific serine/threonine protein kinase [Bertholletia excelsa]
MEKVRLPVEFVLRVAVVVQLCVVDNTAAAPSLSNFTDQLALLAFKAAIKHDPYNVLENWTTSADFCAWAGVSCHRTRRRATILRLPHFGLVGTISPLIGNLSFLRVLVLGNNSFHGHIPPEFGQLRRLDSLLQILSLAANFLTGGIPTELGTLSELTKLYLGANNLTGTIPASLGNLSSIALLGKEWNYIYGELPHGIGSLPNLAILDLQDNSLTGTIPPHLFNLSSLEQVVLSMNVLSGTIDQSVGLWLPNLQLLYLGENELNGEVPVSLSNATNLGTLYLEANRFAGHIRADLGRLKNLEMLNLRGKQLTVEPGSSELGFLAPMTNCTSLQYLLIAGNPWGGSLPESVGNLSNTLEQFGASSSQLKGHIPSGIGYLKVNSLELEHNNLRGSIPSTIRGMERLQKLYLFDNEIEGSIPDGICLLGNLGVLDLHRSKLSGSIPSCIGNLTLLQNLILGSNKLNASIPPSLWSLKNLLFLNLSTNSLVRSLDPSMKPIKTLVGMDLSWNLLSGKIPTTIGAFESLTALNLSKNLLWGPIAESIGNLRALDSLDLSNNNLSGTIPKTLESLRFLKFLNLSFNMLSGEIPSGGVFRNLTAQSFMEMTRKSWKNTFLKTFLASLSLVIAFACYLTFRKYQRRSTFQDTNQGGTVPAIEHKRINSIGEGSFGSVYKGVLADCEIVAVKILNLQVGGAFRSFDVECKVLSTIRHRNLVKSFLIIEYMPNGSPEKWLCSNNQCLDVLQRLSIMSDVAFALEYLHHSQEKPIVHCDLQPSNVLLDEEMVAHVADFGIAKILTAGSTTTQTNTLGTLGYIALNNQCLTEYGSEGKVSVKCDIYSYGVPVLEILTRKKPTDVIFPVDLSLINWVNASLPKKFMEVVDVHLLRTENTQYLNVVKDSLLAILEVGLQCSTELPEERPEIKYVASKLHKMKLNLGKLGAR